MTPHLPNPPNPVAGILNSSNSTASIFLGGARKSWMLNVERNNNNNNTNNLISPQSAAPSTTATATATNHINDIHTDQSRLPPSPATAVVALSSLPAPSASSPPLVSAPPSPTRRLGMPDSPSRFQENLASFRGNNSNSSPSCAVVVPQSTTHNALRRPPSQPPPSSTQISGPPNTTPAIVATSIPLVTPNIPTQVVQSHQQPKPQLQLQQQLPLPLPLPSVTSAALASLPSPDPTIVPLSQTSPPGSTERNRSAIASPSTITFPFTPNIEPSPAPSTRQNAPPVAATTVAGRPASNPRHEDTLSHSHTNPPTSRVGQPSPFPAVAPLARPTSFSSAQITPPDERITTFNNAFFAQAKAKLATYAAAGRKSMLLSESVESPRVQLLIQACCSQDLVYLILHQVYCLSTYAPSEFNKLPGITGKQVHGLETVRHLLVDNHRVSGDFLRWCVRFPGPIAQMLEAPGYQASLKEVCRILARFGESWLSIERHMRTRRCPPLVDEFARYLGILSPTLHFTMWLCLCRRIPGAKVEGRLQDIFARDSQNFQRRLVQPSSPQQMQRENDEVVSAYTLAIAATLANSGPTGALNSPVMTAAPSRPAAPALTSQLATAQPMISTAPASRPALAPARTTHTVGQTHTQVQSQYPNGTAPTPVRSTSSAAPRKPRPAVSTQSIAQHVRGSPHMPTLQGPHSTSSHASRRDWRVYQFQQPTQPPQQPRPAHVRNAQSPHILVAASVNNSTFANSNAIQSPESRPACVPLLPHPGAPPVLSTRPNPHRVALHQAHFRDPINRMVIRDATGEKDTELFPYLQSLVLPPTPLGKVNCAFHWKFSLSKADLERLPATHHQGPGRRILRVLTEGSQIYRLRCARIPTTTTEVSEQSWCLAKTIWPSVIYVFVNQGELFVRRKAHNGRDLPLDISSHLREGLNRISVHFIRSAAETCDVTYAMAVEAHTFSSVAYAKSLAWPLPASESRGQICQRLTSKSTDDDELSIVSDDLVVTLVDPFTASLFKVPVRSRYCGHSECFDHETFLQTRVLKSGVHSLEVDWRCPICRQDARPQNLIVDGFLADVRAEMERTDQCSGARALQIKADGSWEVKTDADLRSSEQATPHPSGSLSKRKSSVLEPIMSPTPQRPKIEQTPSMPRTEPILTPQESQTPPVIILD